MDNYPPGFNPAPVSESLEGDCPKCGQHYVIDGTSELGGWQPVNDDDMFCSKCGWDVSTTRVCPKCGGYVYEPQNWCADCGLRCRKGEKFMRGFAPPHIPSGRMDEICKLLGIPREFEDYPIKITFEVIDCKRIRTSKGSATSTICPFHKKKKKRKITELLP